MSSGKTNEELPRAGGVLDPAWEDALRAGQAADGEAGSVEPELAVLHLLRHARAPEHLPDAALDDGWNALGSAIDAEAPVPWWRRLWSPWVGTAVAATAAAVVLVIVLPPSPGPDGSGGGQGAGEGGGSPVATATGQAEALERQFQLLAPGARERVAARVEQDRGKMRDDLLALAKRSGASGTVGGAP